MPSKLMNNVIAEYRSNFYKIYYSEIMPIFLEFETKRKSQLTKLTLIEIVLCVILYFAIKYGILIDNVYLPIFFGIFLLSLFLLLFMPFNFNGKFVTELKNVCMRRVLKAFGDIEWEPKTDIVTDNQLVRSDLFGIFNTRSSDDAFRGSYKDVKFSVCETELLYITGSGKSKSVQQVFNGVVINFEANKHIKNKTIIATKGDNNIKGRNCVVGGIVLAIAAQAVTDLSTWWFYVGFAAIIGVIGFCVSKLIPKDKEILNEIKLEDPEFNKKYRAYSSDEVEGRYLITPAFMERFNNVKTAFGAKKIKCSFYDEDLMFAITSSKNLFEIGNLFHSLNSPQAMTVFFEELVSILLLVDYFKLDERTGL